ncbi:hypothetical protein ILUMI_12184 [Ignelater luminosus]|uniref:CS domain-containing protein n=1 Tax=Ignelater luminosus TaxID=2038154 RepID=A0A8K0D021_IGNLU|nr:hypothetical protein ILUMI_12184 [Ignelater luminosus]
MPLIVKDFKWRQTEALIIIQVPLHGIHQSKVDLFTSPKYIKASFERYFFEAFLLYEVNISNSKCTLTATDIIFELVKHEDILWDKLEIDVSKKEKLELKKKLIEEEHKNFQNTCKEKYDKNCHLKKVAVQEQIGLDTKQRDLIDKIRNDEKNSALGDLEKWQQKITQPKIIELPSDSEDSEEEKPIIVPKKTTFVRQKKLPVTSDPVPLPRKTATLKVDFTARQFPTPSRESQLEEENEWLRKQAEVRRSIGFVSEDLRPEEKNPQYLKSKGEEFLKAENYLGAISAFSFGIKLTDQFPDLYIGRSEAHFKHGNFYKATQDCSKAIELLRPAVPSNLKERVTCISRRGKALAKMGYFKEGISELEVAIKLCPNDEELKNALVEMKDELNATENQND